MLQITPGAVFQLQRLAASDAGLAALAPSPSGGSLSEGLLSPLMAPSFGQPDGRRKLQAGPHVTVMLLQQ